MGQTLRIIAGSDGGPWRATLLNEGVHVSFPPSATFLATFSRGGEEASLFTPAVSWIDSTAGTIQLSTNALDTANIDVGTYYLQIFVISAGEKIPAFNGQVEILPTVGSITPPMAWCAFEDMLDYSTVLQTMDSRRVDITGFLNLRARVTSELIRDIIKRYNPRPGFIKVRQNTLDPMVGQDKASPTAVAPSKFAITAALNAGHVIFEKQLVEIVARRSIALVMSRQSTSDSKYRQEAMDQRAMADDLWRCYQCQVDLDGDGVPDCLVDMDVILLPPGVAA